MTAEPVPAPAVAGRLWGYERGKRDVRPDAAGPDRKQKVARQHAHDQDPLSGHVDSTADRSRLTTQVLSPEEVRHDGRTCLAHVGGPCEMFRREPAD